jgi:hypothetical protein
MQSRHLGNTNDNRGSITKRVGKTTCQQPRKDVVPKWSCARLTYVLYVVERGRKWD